MQACKPFLSLVAGLSGSAVVCWQVLPFLSGFAVVVRFCCCWQVPPLLSGSAVVSLFRFCC